MIPVVWHEPKEARYSDGEQSRYRYGCATMLNDMFDTYECQHFINYHTGMPQVDGAVIVISGGHENELVERINKDVAQYKWVLFIGIADEESEFPYHLLRHPNMKLWLQAPIPGRHTFADRYLLFGYMWDCRKYMKQLPRCLDWFFSGQVTHDRRREMVEQLRKLPQCGHLVETQGFAQGLSSLDYFDLMSQSKIVLCPTGPATPDSFRFAEALEYGCIPIVDEKPSWKKDYPNGFWQMMFPTRPFPVVENWSDLPRIMSHLLDNYERRQEACAGWWKEYKQDFYSWLGRDLHALGAFTKERGPLLTNLRVKV